MVGIASEKRTKFLCRCADILFRRPAKPARMRKKQRLGAAEAAAAADGAPGALVWLRQDLRLHDNAALAAAAQHAAAAGGMVTIAFVHSPEEDGDDFRTGAFTRNVRRSLSYAAMNQPSCLASTP